MTPIRVRVLSVAVLLAAVPGAALAYVGPGLGTGVIASVLGVLAGIGMLIVGVIWYPIKKLGRRLRRKR